MSESASDAQLNEDLLELALAQMVKVEEPQQRPIEPDRGRTSIRANTTMEATKTITLPLMPMLARAMTSKVGREHSQQRRGPVSDGDFGVD